MYIQWGWKVAECSLFNFVLLGYMFSYVFVKDKTVIYFRDCADRCVIEMRVKENPVGGPGFQKKNGRISSSSLQVVVVVVVKVLRLYCVGGVTPRKNI